jgi:threonine/homoserine/homoserine lactone efflux protein
MDAGFLAFLGVSAVVIATPGQDTALTIRNTLIGGRRAGIATAVGVALGQSCWTLGASVGLTAVLLASEVAFMALRLIGAGYLVYLGTLSIWNAIRARPRRDVVIGDPKLPAGSALRQGAMSNLGNPKMAVFFSSLLPQFVPASSSSFAGMLGLGIVFVSMTLTWLTVYAAVVDRLGAVLQHPRVRRAFDAVMGAVLVAFGARLATDSDAMRGR